MRFYNRNFDEILHSGSGPEEKIKFAWDKNPVFSSSISPHFNPHNAFSMGGLLYYSKKSCGPTVAFNSSKSVPQWLLCKKK